MILDRLRGGMAALGAAAVLWSCGGTPNAAPTQPPPGRLRVACTISTLCALVASVGGDAVALTGIVPVGASPETYEPTPSDVVAVSRSKIVFQNGLGLETWLAKIVGGSGQTVVTLADAVDARERESGNPHLWMDPAYARAYVDLIASTLARADPRNATAYRTRAAAQRARLAVLDRWIRAQIASIPPERRTMICFHDAFYYFDRRYGIENVGVIEPSPGQEPSPGSFARLIALARAHDVHAVFAEPQFSPKLAAALASGARITVVADLYDDTLGTGGAQTYEGMMRYDVATIVSALRR